MAKYTIKKGKHYSNTFFLRHIIPCNAIIVDRIVRFDRSCLNTYSPDDPNRFDVNKLFGFTLGCFNPKWNSIRFGWIGHPDRIELFSFIHREGKFEFKPIRLYDNLDLEVGVDYRMRIIEIGTGYQLSVINPLTNRVMGGHLVEIKARNWGFPLFPYFGGDNTAPHDISIYMS